MGPRLVTTTTGQVACFENRGRSTVVRAAFCPRPVRQVVADLIERAHARGGHLGIDAAIAKFAPHGRVAESVVRVFARGRPSRPGLFSVLLDDMVPEGLAVLTPRSREVGSIWQLGGQVAAVVYDPDWYVVATC